MAIADLAHLNLAVGNSDLALARLRAIVDWFPSTLEISELVESRRLLQSVNRR